MGDCPRNPAEQRDRADDALLCDYAAAGRAAAALYADPAVHPQQRRIWSRGWRRTATPTATASWCCTDSPTSGWCTGPEQIEARVNQNPEIAQQLNLWNQQGSQVFRGNLLVIPLGRTMLYFKPIYLRARSEGAIPELKKVVLASGDRVVMTDTVEEGLQLLLAERAGRTTPRRPRRRRRRPARRAPHPDRPAQPGATGEPTLSRGAGRPQKRRLGCLRRAHAPPGSHPETDGGGE